MCYRKYWKHYFCASELFTIPNLPIAWSGSSVLSLRFFQFSLPAALPILIACYLRSFEEVTC